MSRHVSRLTGDSAAAGGDWGPGVGGRQPGLHRGRHPRHRAPLPGQWCYLAAGVRSYITLHYITTLQYIVWLLLVFMLEAVLGLVAYVYQVSLSHCHANCSIILVEYMEVNVNHAH